MRTEYYTALENTCLTRSSLTLTHHIQNNGILFFLDLFYFIISFVWWAIVIFMYFRVSSQLLSTASNISVVSSSVRDLCSL